MGFRLSNRMTDAGYYRGTTADQDTRFGDKTKKLMKILKFSDQLDQPVDMRKVKLDAMKPWIHEKLVEILGFEDDVVIDYAINQLEETNNPDPKAVQINLTGFLNAKNARLFMAELWPMLLSAQSNAHGIPDKLIELTRQEMETVKADAEKMQKFQSNIQNIQETLKKGREDEGEETKVRPDRSERRREDGDRRERKRERRRSRSRSKKRSRSRDRKKRSRSRERKHKHRSRSRERRRERKRSRSRDRKRSGEKRREKSKSKSREPPSSSADQKRDD